MSNTIKGATKSKTIWLAVLVGILPQLIDALPLLEEVLAEYYKPVLYVLGALMAALRVVTNEPLSSKG